MKVRAHVWVKGRVQGVSFRAWTQREASEQGIAGWVRNLEDGRVEAVFEGDRSAVDAMVVWSHQGSPGARVETVQVVWEETIGERDFVIRR